MGTVAWVVALLVVLWLGYRVVSLIIGMTVPLSTLGESYITNRLDSIGVTRGAMSPNTRREIIAWCENLAMMHGRGRLAQRLKFQSELDFHCALFAAWLANPSASLPDEWSQNPSGALRAMFTAGSANSGHG